MSDPVLDSLDYSRSGRHELTTDVGVKEEERRIHPSVLIPEHVTQIVLLRVAVSQAAWTEAKTHEAPPLKTSINRRNALWTDAPTNNILTSPVGYDASKKFEK